MSGSLAGPVLALQVQAGTAGFFVVVLLIVACVGLFMMMSRSLKRMKNHVSEGDFRGTEPRRPRSSVPDQVAVRDQSSDRD